MTKQFYSSVVFSILILLPFAVDAGVLKGKVTDAKGEALPFATVFIQGTTVGTTTNADAGYQLTLAPGTHKVLCQYMGFKRASFNVTIKGDETVSHNFVLQEQALEMNDVVIKANSEDPAYGIMRKVIERRRFHLNQVQSFQSSIYLKGVLRNRAMPEKISGVMKAEDGQTMKKEMGLDSTGKGMLYLVEQEAEYYSKGDEQRTVIKSVKESGDPHGYGFSRMPSVISFYQNNLNPMGGVAPRGFISPASDNAISYYKFKYEGEFHEGGFTIDKIKVTPRRLYEPLFEGTIYIVEGDWAIYSLDLLATKTAGIQVMDTLRIQQTFLPLKPDTWVIKNQLIYPTINFMGFDVAGHFITVYDNQKVNEPIPDTVFAGKVISQYAKDATSKDTNYWSASRPVPLEEDESQDYIVKDSLREKYQNPHYIDSMRRVYNKFKPQRIIFGGFNFDTKGYKNNIATNALLSINNPLVSFNTVEGLVVAPRVWWSHEIDTYNHINTTVAARYGFSSNRFNAIGRVAYRRDRKDWRGRWWQTGFEAGRYVFQFNPQSTLSPLVNTFSTLVYGRNHMKLYERWNGAVFFEKNHGNGFSWKVNLNYQDRTPLLNTTSYSWSDHSEKRLTTNIPQPLKTRIWESHRAVLASIALSYKPGITYIQFPDYKQPNSSRWPLFTLNYEKGIPDLLDSKTDFDKWRFGIEDNLNLKLLGQLSYRIAAGGFLNDNYVSIPDMMHLRDNEVVVAAPYLQSFQLMPYYYYSNTADVYGELHVEYSMKGLLTNKLPIIRKAQWYLVLGNNSFYVDQNNFYTEAFIGVDNLGYKLARFLRVDFIHSWNSLNRSMIGIRVGLKSSGMIRVNARRNDGAEW